MKGLYGGVALFALTCSAAAFAAEDQSASINEGTASPESTSPAQDEVNGQDEANAIVVTGTSTAQKRAKAPYSITTFNEEAIAREAPTSITDLISSTPGVSAEPSSGLGGSENIYVRGLPGGGYFFTGMQVDGLPVYQDSQEAFTNADELYRVDMMTRSVEVVRGGTAPIYQHNATGALVNLLTRHGSEQFEGGVRATYGDWNSYRADGYVSGPVTSRLSAAIGGYYRIGDGLRNTGYTTDKGGQITLGATYRAEAGTITADLRYLNERNGYYSSIPLRNPATGASLASFIDPNNGTLLSTAIARQQVRVLDGTPTGGVMAGDLTQGVHPKLFSASLNAEFDLGTGWSISTRNRFTTADVSFNSLFTNDPVNASAYAASRLGAAQAAFGATVTRLGYVIAAPGNSANRTPFDPSTTAGLVMPNNGYWIVQTKLRNLISDNRVNKEFEAFGRHNLTLGLYLADYSFHQRRNFNSMLTTITDNAMPLDLVAYNAAGAVVGSVTENGFVRYGSGVLDGKVEGRSIALYGTESWQIADNLTLDVGIRYQEDHQRGYSRPGVSQDLRNGDLSLPLALSNVGGVGAYVYKSEVLKGTAYTAGLSYQPLSSIAMHARYTRGYRTPRGYNIYLGQTNKVQTADLGEIGVKFARPGATLFVTGYWNRFNDLAAGVILLNPTTGLYNNVQLSGKTRTLGVEVEAHLRPVDWFSLTGGLTLQDPQTRNLADAAGVSYAGVNGKQISRTPKIMASLTPTVDLNLGGLPVELSATVYHQGRRYSDFINATELPSYTTVDASVSVDATKNLNLALRGSNLTNAVGLTEGNPRTDTISGPVNGPAAFARPIFGRTFTAAATFKW